jgi:hypothetical protein
MQAGPFRPYIRETVPTYVVRPVTVRVGGNVDRPLEIFFSYAHEDEDLMNDVRRQLIVYERNGRILKWHDRMIPLGTEWRGQIDLRLEAARVVLLFMSPLHRIALLLRS